MSEFIEKRRELSVQEYEFMRHLKLFTGDEIRDIKNKRFQHEHKVERRAKDLVDFINYIVYENNLLELLEERRKKLRIQQGRHSLESSIQNRIKLLYKRAMDRFPAKFQLWIHYLKHCERYGFTSEGSRMLDKMLNYHGDKSKAWINAANWEYTQMDNMDRARHFMFRGLQRHPDCREMYLSFLQLQLTEAEKIAEASGEKVEELLEQEDSHLKKSVETIHLIYNHYKKRDTDIEFFVELLSILKHSKIVKSFTTKVLEDMKLMFAQKELMWHSLAQLALDGLYVSDHEEPQEVEPKSKLKGHIKSCVQIYDTAVNTLATKQMWTYYIDAMLELNQDMSSEQKLRRKSLGTAFNGAYKSGFLEEEKFVQYLKLLMHADRNQHNSTVPAVLSNAIEAYPHSTSLWEINLLYLAQKGSTCEQVDSVFKNALQQCKDNMLSLWIARFQYYHARTDLSSNMEVLFKEAIYQPPKISSHFQPLFLEFLVVTRSIAAARTAYREMQRNCTACLALHQKMMYLESTQAQPSIVHWRMCHENATQCFGTSNTEVWIDYIRFERDHGAPKNIPNLFERAKSRLDAELVADFINEYELLKNPLVQTTNIYFS